MASTVPCVVRERSVSDRFLPSGLFVRTDNDTVKIAADEVTYYYARVQYCYAREVLFPEIKAASEVIKCVGNAVREAADNEHRNAEKKWQIVVLTGKRNCRGHQETTSYCKGSGS